MLLKKISLNNIRSYENLEVEFSKGSTLLSGDIGSGKTSILLAIEFALFGLQPGQRGHSLLRNSKDEGGVKIEFEIEGKNVLIERTLKRGKTVNQDYASITIDDEKQEVSVTELKNTVLDLLAYPREFAKKQNLLYKFTVYTPQEEMKEIILQDPETRINTLRHVFGIDKYKQLIENIAIVTSKLREERRIKEALIGNLEQDKLFLIQKEEELEAKRYNLVSMEKELFNKQEIRKTIQEEKNSISEKIEQKQKLNQEVEKTKIIILNKQDSIGSNRKVIEQLKQQIDEVKETAPDPYKILSLEKSIKEKRMQKQELSDKNLEISSQISSLNLKNRENDSLKEKISKLDICPTCLQDVVATYKANIFNQTDSNIVENVKKIETLNLQKIKLTKEIYELEADVDSTNRQIQELKLIKIKLEGINEKKLRLQDLEKLNISLEKDKQLLKQHIESLQYSVFELKKYDSLFEEKQRELDESLKQERQAEIRVAELKKEISLFLKQIEELELRIKKTEEIKTTLEYISSLESWLSERFVPLITHIEKNVMVKLKSEFSKLFSEWFAMLVSDNFNVHLDDDFTPIIEQQDYEIDYPYLSGGERTAVALAYRLALNQVINSLLSKIKTKDLVILDEPTDGFSEAQLDKMRDVLQELNIAQLIIVSHEQKIEGFVENVFRFKKEGGVSKRV